ncbi:MAG: hypothetical protein R6X02_34375 [Enhygromyxa sp.]
MPRPALLLGLLWLGLSSACSGSSSAGSDDVDAPATGTGDGLLEEQQCGSDDALEPNEVPQDAARLSWTELGTEDEGSLGEATIVLETSLCAGEHDWYLIPIAELGLEFHVVNIDGLVRGASWCGHRASCTGETLPSAPENTLAIEVYDAASLVLLGSDLSTRGRVDVDGWGPSYSRDLLIHIHAPSIAASYDYQLQVAVRSDDVDDDCEC